MYAPVNTTDRNVCFHHQ